MTKYFTLKEMTRSATASVLGINNTPPPEVVKNLEELMEVLDEIREGWGGPIKVTSGYRCPKLNKIVGGSPTSAHKIGEAADLVPMNGDINGFINYMLEWAKTHSFDQLILERSAASRWVHLGYRNNKGGQRKQIKSMVVK